MWRPLVHRMIHLELAEADEKLAHPQLDRLVRALAA
jgi:hypothetical protein